MVVVPDDDACLDYLDWLRWPDGFECPHCGWNEAWQMAGGVRRCAECRRRVSVTAGTIFEGTRTPLTVWFSAAWSMTTAANGVSAVELKRLLGLGSYQTAWTMLHRYRAAMGTMTGTDLLAGRVEVDETLVGGEKPGPGGRGALGKTLVGVAVELRDPKGFGRVRLRVLADASTTSLRDCVTATVTPGATVVTDGWQPYRAALAPTWVHERLPIHNSGQQTHELLPAVHRVASQFKRWLLGTHQGSITPGHLPAYLDEFTFRFNRRRSRHRGMLFYRLLQASVAARPVTYKTLVMAPKPKRVHPTGVAGPRSAPGTLARPDAHRPWRTAP